MPSMVSMPSMIVRQPVLRLLAVVSLFLLLGVTSAWAATGGLKVVVYAVEDGETKEVLPGATVQLSEPNGQLQTQVLITDVNGEALFPVIPVGSTYVVTVSMPGFGTVTIDEVRVVANQIAPVPVALASQLTEEIEVIDRGDVVELQEGTKSETKISDELFEDLPVFGRQFQNVLSVAAGVQDSDGDGNPNVHGSRESDFKMVIGGVSNQDPLTGESMGSVNADAIEEIVVVDSGADASFSGAIGGFGEVTLKTGTNEFEGSVQLLFRDSVFDNDGAGGEPLDFEQYIVPVYFSGPIVKDRLWFNATHEYNKSSIPVDLIGGPDFTQSFRQTSNVDQVTWQVSGKNQLKFLYRSEPFRIDPAGVTSRIPPESGYILERDTPTATVTWRNNFSGSLFFETLVGYQEIRSRQNPFDPTAQNTCFDADNINQGTQVPPTVVDAATARNTYCLDTTVGSLISGPAPLRLSEDTKIWTYDFRGEKFVGDWLGGTHQIRFGARVDRATYERDLRFDQTFQLEDAPAIVTGGTGGGFASSSEVIQVTQRFPNRRASDADRTNFRMFLTDTWNILDNLTLTVGAVWSREEVTADGFVPIDPRGEEDRFQEIMDACVDLRAESFGVYDRLPGSTGERQLAQLVALCSRQAQIPFSVYPLDDPSLYAGSSSALNPYVWNNWTSTGVGGPVYNTAQLLANNGVDVNTEPRIRQRERFTVENTNLEPRISIAWDPFNDGKTKISASWNRYVGDTFLAPFVFEQGPDAIQTAVRTERSGDGFLTLRPTGTAGRAFTINQVDRDLRRQRADEWALRFEREIAPETSLVLRYVNRRYKDQLQRIDLNARPVFWEDIEGRLDQFFDPEVLTIDQCERIGEFADCTGGQRTQSSTGPFGGSVLRPAPDGIPDIQSINPNFNQIYEVGNYNSSSADAVIVELTRRFYKNWEMKASYTWSEAIGQAEQFNSVLGDDPTNVQLERGPLAFDQRHVVTLFGRVFIPRWGGFRVGGVLTYQSGLPYSIIEQRTVSDFPSKFLNDDIRSLPGLPEGYDGPGDGVGLQYASLVAAYGFSGNVPKINYNKPRLLYPTGQRNDQRNEPFWNLDLNLQKEFDIKDVRATVKVSVYNALNADPLRILGVQENSTFNRQEGRRIVLSRTPSATRAFGRRFELMLKANF